MAHILIMPRQGNTVESCIIVRWRVAEGQTLNPDDVVCEVETDKASFDLPAGASGVLLKILRAEGDDVPVLEPIAVIGQAGEEWQPALGAPGGLSPKKHDQHAPASAGKDTIDKNTDEAGRISAPSEPSATIGERTSISPRARRLASAEGVDSSRIEGTGPAGRVIERDIEVALKARPALTAAARAAVLGGASIPEAGEGGSLGGRIGLSELGGRGQTPNTEPKNAVPGVAGAITETPLKGIRKIISERMLESLATTAQLTFNSSADASKLQNLRSRFKSSDPELGLREVTIGDLVLFAVSRVLPSYPNGNATLEDDILRSYERVHLALAVDTPRGLMVPVIRNADLLSLREIAAESKRLATACNAGSVGPDELAGGTFTVTNLGSLGVESFTPVLNAPQVAILGVDAITPRAAEGPNGSLVLEKRIGLSLTVDHRAVDGAPAARLLKAIADAIADIDFLLLTRG